MIKSSILVLAAFIAVPVAAQMADAAAPASYPICSAKVKDGCQQPPKQEARAISGAQAEKRGKHMDDGQGATPGMAAAAPASAAPMTGTSHKSNKLHKMKNTDTPVAADAATPPPM